MELLNPAWLAILSLPLEMNLNQRGRIGRLWLLKHLYQCIHPCIRVHFCVLWCSHLSNPRFSVCVSGSSSTLSSSDAARRRSWDLPKEEHDILGKGTCVHRSPCTSFSVPSAARRRHRSEPRVICSYPGPAARWHTQTAATFIRLSDRERGPGGHEKWRAPLDALRRSSAPRHADVQRTSNPVALSFVLLRKKGKRWSFYNFFFLLPSWYCRCWSDRPAS